MSDLRENDRAIRCVEGDKDKWYFLFTIWKRRGGTGRESLGDYELNRFAKRLGVAAPKVCLRN